MTGFPEQDLVPLTFTRMLLKHFSGNVNFVPERRLQILSSKKYSSPYQPRGSLFYSSQSVEGNARENARGNIKNRKQSSRGVLHVGFAT